VARDVQQFVKCIQELAARWDRLHSMRVADRAYALTKSWDRVFEAVYAGYERELKNCHSAGKKSGFGRDRGYARAKVTLAGPGKTA
jgi:hypothetical protein